MAIELYNFQRKDVNRFIAEGHKSGLFAYDMALGKTMTATTLAVELGTKVNLIVAPQITRKGWEKAVETQTDGKFEMQWIKNGTKAGEKVLADFYDGKPGFYFITWQLMRRGLLHGEHADMVIADEVHEIVNKGGSDQNIALNGIQSEYRVGLSGTPSGNKIDGLFGVINWLWPNQYKSYWKWLEKFFILVGSGYALSPVREIRKGSVTADFPFFVRRMKDDHYSEMVPEPLETEAVEVELTNEQRRIYDTFNETSGAWLDPDDTDKGFLYAPYSISKAMRLREISLGTPVIVEDEEGKMGVDFPEDAKSTKLNALVDVILPKIGEEPLVVYTHSKKFVKFLVHRLNELGFSAKEFSGDLKLADKERMIEELGHTYQILVATIQAVGTGTDGLQHKCSRLVWMSRSVKVSENIQARDRLYRPGQQEKIQSWEIVANNTSDLDTNENLSYSEDMLEMLLNANKLQP